MKVIITYHRDTKEMLYATPTQIDSTPEEYRGNVYVLNEKAFTDAIHYWECFSFTADIPIKDFKPLFIEQCIRVIKRKKEAWNQ